MSGAGLIECTAAEAVAGISRGDFSAEEYARALLERCAEAASLNAFITLEPEKVMAAARQRDQERRSGTRHGPLLGLPVPIKDSISTRDYPTTAGTQGLRGFRPCTDAAVVKRLRDAGAIVLGKTNLHELSYGWTSHNEVFGPVRNPYDPQRIAGGSSGGTAATVAAGMSPLGVGEDTNGSIRIPAALCGVCGLRPTTGRYPNEGCVPLTPLFDQVGPMARTVADLALFDSVMTDDPRPILPQSLRGVRLGVIREYYYSDLDREIDAATSVALARLRREGVVLVELQFPELAAVHAQLTYPVIAHDAPAAIAQYLRDYGAGVSFEQLIAQASPEIRAGFQAVMAGGVDFVSDVRYSLVVQQEIPALRRRFQEHFSRSSLSGLIFPATRVPPLPVGRDAEVLIGDRKISTFTALARNITPTGTVGLPGLVLPAGLTQSGLPVGIELDAPAGADRALLAIGMAVARVLGSLPPPRLSGH